MPASPAQRIRSVLRVQGDDRLRAARREHSAGIDWASWTPAFNQLHGEDPRAGEQAARALCRVAGEAGDVVGAARFRLLHGVGLQRTGSMEEAAQVLAKAAGELQACGEAAWSAKAGVLLVDALAHAGRIEEAILRAGRVRPVVAATLPPVWGAHLDGNLGNAHRLAGDLEEAYRLYAKVRGVYRDLGREVEAAVAQVNIGVVMLYMGEGDAARREFHVAAKVFRELGHADRATEAEYNAACADVARGKLATGIQALEVLATSHASNAHVRGEALCRMDLAAALLRAGDWESAAEQARRASHGFRLAQAAAEGLEADLWHAVALVRQAPAEGRAALAAVAARAAGDLDRRDIALRAELLQLQVRREFGSPVEPAGIAELRRRADDLGQAEVVGELDLLAAHVAFGAGRYAEARSRFGQASLHRPGRAWIRVAAETGMAQTQAAQGESAAALERLASVIERTDAIRGALPGAWLRTSFLLERLDPYMTRIEILLARGSASDRREAQQRLDELATRRFHEGWERVAGSPRLRALRARLESIYDRLTGGEGPLRGSSLPRAVWEQDAERLEREIADVWREGERRAERPDHAAGSDTLHPAALPPATICVHLWTHGGCLALLIGTAADAPVIVDVGSLGGLADELGELAFHARRAGRLASPAGAKAVAAILESLGQRLTGQLLEHADGCTALWIVGADSAPDVPWELLTVDGKSLAARLPVTRVPALAARARDTETATGLTVIALSPPDLPGVAKEAEFLAAHGTVHSGADASRRVVARALSNSQVVHLAGHGFDAAGAPALGGVRVADGWFTVADLPDRVRSELVVLAACRTGVGAGRAAAAWGGLPQALLRRGARHVLWTAGDVDDATTAGFARAFHAARATCSVPRAFAQAIQAVHAEQRHCGNLVQFRLSGLAS